MDYIFAVLVVIFFAVAVLLPRRLLAYFYFPAYLLVAGPFMIYAFIGGIAGKRGTYHQVRDGGVVASIIVFPIAFYLHN